MTFHMGRRAVYPANFRWCVKCLRWKTNKGAKFRPFVCGDCLKEKK